jgi:valyl-tRNA synthetase
VVEDLKAGGFLIEIEPHKHNVGECYRCHTTVEPWVSYQWFVKMEPLAKPAIEAVRNKDIKIIPERFEKTYYNWMENIRDWCISRQLWWGHRLPVWYCDDCGEITVTKEDTVAVCPKCGSTHVRQDEDTLDTWFSSALWPFSTLGWPDDTKDLKYFYPTNTLVTGYDIIFFWVSRMIFSGLENMGEAPFNTVLMHGIVRDAQGRKMSKSLGNGIDPLEEIDKYGADALRFTLATGNSPGNDMRYMPEKAEASRNFANKIWNAARFVLMNLDENEAAPHLPETLALEDKWILTRYNDLVKEVTENLEKFELGIAVAKLYDFIWDVLCDWYIELCKTRLNGDDMQAKADAKAVLVYVMSNTLKLLHPFMPFITEEIWQTLPHDGETVMTSNWPVYDEGLNFAADAVEFERIMDAIRAIRNRRAEMNVAPSKKAAVNIATKYADTFKTGGVFFQKLASASDVNVGETFDLPGAVSIVTADATIYIPMDQLVDFEAEIARLAKEKEQTEKILAGVMAKLNNEAFVSKAPAPIVENQREAAARLQEKIKLIDESIASMQNR